VEEQFYLIFPVLLVSVMRFGSRVASTLLALVAILSFTLAENWIAVNAGAAFFLLPARAWELLLGSIVAFCFDQSRTCTSKWSGTLAFAGLMMILLPVSLYDRNTPFPGFYALAPAIGAAFVIVFASDRCFVGRVLSSRLLVSIGLISYSLYLWHQPILAFARIYKLDELTAFEAIASIGFAFLMAFISKHFVEDYFRYKALKGKPKQYLLATLCLSLFVGAIGLMLHSRLGFPERSELNLRLAQNFGLSQKCNGADIDEVNCRTGESPKVVLWGDSYAMHLGKAINASVPDGFIQATLSACPPVLGFEGAPIKTDITCEKFNELIASELVGAPNSYISTVIMSSPFEAVLDSDVRAKFIVTIRYLDSLGVRVIVVSPTPTSGDIVRCIKRVSRGFGSYDDCNFERRNIKNRKVFDALDMSLSGLDVKYVDLRDAICADGTCRVVSNGVILYRDDGHLSNDSAELISNFILAQVPDIGKRTGVREATSK